MESGIHIESKIPGIHAQITKLRLQTLMSRHQHVTGKIRINLPRRRHFGMPRPRHKFLSKTHLRGEPGLVNRTDGLRPDSIPVSFRIQEEIRQTRSPGNRITEGVSSFLKKLHNHVS